MDIEQTEMTSESAEIASCATCAPSSTNDWITRDESYGQLRFMEKGFEKRRSRTALALRRVRKVLEELTAHGADEHGGWEVGIGHPTSKRTVAINHDIYGIDIVHGQELGVVQVRRYEKKTTWDFASIRKNYFLVGRNESTETAFAHPIPAAVVHAAIRRDPSPASPVTAARAWVFGVSRDRLHAVIRQGDVALIPVRRLPVGEQKPVAIPMTVVDSHVVSGDSIVSVGERLYALNPRLTHAKGQHADVSGEGWHRVQVGQRASFWRFASPTAD